MTGPDPDLAVSVLAAFDDMPVGVLIVRFSPTAPPRRVYVNRAAARLYEGEVEALLAQPVPLRIATHDRERFVAMQQRWLDGEPFDEVVEVDIETMTGAIVPILVRSAGGQIGADRIRISFLQDLRPRRHSEAALRASEALFRRLAEAAPDAMIIIADGLFRYANAAALRTLGHERAETLLGTAVASLLTPEDARVMAVRIRRQLAGEGLPPRDYGVRRSDGTWLTLEISATPIQFAGQPAILAVGRDVEERKRHQAELIRADRMAAVGTLAAGVAHEINNPLTYVVLQLDRLRAAIRALVPAPERRAAVDEMVGDALDGSRRVAHIVRDLLWFARDDAAPSAAVELQEPVTIAHKLATAALRDRARVRIDLEGVPAVVGNAPRLTQVFVNLLVNAAQAFIGGGPDTNAIDVTWHADGDAILVEVADNGPGLPPHAAGQIFEPFFTTKPGGTGLGLAISRSIVLELGGAIAAFERPGGGAVLQVRLARWRD
ncbi:MAG: PAS domain S-box protein [Deltaproteobacteria bacterium]|nr:PAS domain S-box protein [Deltaproteobacteria bacterium]